MKRNSFVGMAAVLTATCALAFASGAAAQSEQRVFLEPISIQSLNTKARTATLLYAPTATNPNPALGGTSTSTEAITIDSATSTLLTLPLTPNAMVVRKDASGAMQEMKLKAAGAALAAHRIDLRAEFQVASSGQLMISRLVASDTP